MANKTSNGMNLNRILPLIIPLLVVLLEEVYFFFPKQIFLMAVSVNLLVFFVVWQFTRASEVDKKWWNYLILPAVLSTTVMAYTIFLSAKFFVQILIAFNCVFLYLYLRHIYYYLLKPSAYKVFSIENISTQAGWLTFFLLAATIYGLQSFLNFPFIYLALIILAISALIIYQIIWADKIELRVGLPYILISCLILVELLWSISFLPFNYNISGLCLAICYYMIIGLVKNHLLGKLDSKKVKMYLILGSVSLFLILFTAKWI